MYDPLFALLMMFVAVGLGLLILWPQHGLYTRWRRYRWMTERVLSEDALKRIYAASLELRRPTIQSIAGSLSISADHAAQLLDRLTARQLVRLDDGAISLTAEGQAYARHITRAHRLWELHLAEQTGLHPEEWHGQAERLEHDLSPDEIQKLAVQLGYPSHDPHGDPIPPAEGDPIPPTSKPLNTVPPGESARIVHLEDEPTVVYAQLMAEELYPGTDIRVQESTDERIRFWAGGREHTLAPLVAANVAVMPLPVGGRVDVTPQRHLDSLQPGQDAKIIGISPQCHGVERRRLLDLGVLPGTVVGAEFASPSGDPVAYRIRGALIALRRDQARLIDIEGHDNAEAEALAGNGNEEMTATHRHHRTGATT